MNRTSIHPYVYVLLIALWVLPSPCSAGIFSKWGIAQKERVNRVTKLHVETELKEQVMLAKVKMSVSIEDIEKSVKLISGDVSLEKWHELKNAKLSYDVKGNSYTLKFEKRGEYNIEAQFLCKSTNNGKNLWQASTLVLAESEERRVSVTPMDMASEVKLEGVLRMKETQAGGKKSYNALLRPQQALGLRWKSGAKVSEGALVLSADANAIVNIGHGEFVMDSFFRYSISQGELKELSLDIPQGVQVTGVQGLHIQDWHVDELSHQLKVKLNQAQKKQYHLQVFSEQTFGALPLNVELLSLRPLHCIRSSGSLLVGGDHAILATLRETSGLVQINTNAFEKVKGIRGGRKMPRKMAYGFKHSTSQYALALALKKIVPVYDVAHEQVLQILENNLVINDKLELNVKDAPLKQLVLELPLGFSLSRISGFAIHEDEVHIHNTQEKGAGKQVKINFRKELHGKTVLDLEIEMGRNPMGKKVSLGEITVLGARSSRGTLKISSEKGLSFSVVSTSELREINVASALGAVHDVMRAFRYKNEKWAISLMTQKKESGIHAETFHLMNINEQMIYGSVAVSYFINDAPVDELKFLLPDTFHNVEFVGGDIRRWSREGKSWVVHLNRKVMGDYNLGIIYHHRLHDKNGLMVNNVICEETETQSGYVSLVSHEGMNVSLIEEVKASMIRIPSDELPEHYQLLIGSPIIDCYKHIGPPQKLQLGLNYYETSKVLPALIELATIKTEIVPSREEQTAISTRLEYKIINTDKQYMTISIPEGARVWSTRIQKSNGQPFKKALSTLEGSMLKIALPRNPNPNEPATVEVEYGQSYDALSFLGEMSLQAPREGLRSTFSRWEVNVPKDWGIRKKSDAPWWTCSPTRLTAFLSNAWAHWQKHAVKTWSLHSALVLGYALLVLGLMVLLFMLKKSLMKAGLVILCLIPLIAQGFYSASQPWVLPETIRAMSNYSQLSHKESLQLSSEFVPEITFSVMPLWLNVMMAPECMGLLIMALLVLTLSAVFRAYRRFFFAIALALVLSAVMTFPGVWQLFYHLFSWLIPGVWALMMVISCLKQFEFKKSLRAKELVAGATLLTLFCSLDLFSLEAAKKKSHKAVVKDVAMTVSPSLQLTQLKGEVTVEKDALALKWFIDVQAEERGHFYLPAKSMMLLPSKNMNEDLKICKEGNRMRVDIERQGQHQIEFQVLSVLPIPENSLSGQLQMPLPLALKSEIILKIPTLNMRVLSRNAVWTVKEELESWTHVKSYFEPGQGVHLNWEPRTRERKHEKAKVFCHSLSVVSFERGLVQTEHLLDLNIPQGVVRELSIKVPASDAVTGVDGKSIASWRFDPDHNLLAISLSADAQESYALRVVCESPVLSMPHTYSFRALEVLNCQGFKASVGFRAGAGVSLSSQTPNQLMDTESFKRMVATKLGLAKKNNKKEPHIVMAFGLQSIKTKVSVTMEEKQTEIRSKEKATFAVSDERLVYHGTLDLNISKAGRFSFDISFPKGYDIDSLHNTHMSHWEELEQGEEKVIRVYLNEWLLGSTSVNLTLSRNISELPDVIPVPQLRVISSLKHGGRLTVSAARGMRMNIHNRNGLSEIRQLQGDSLLHYSKSFRILQNDWLLEMKPEIVKPRINADVLLTHNISEGMVKHNHRVHFSFFNAGVKNFSLHFPEDALAVVIKGPKIAQILDKGHGLREIKLEEKWFGKTYPLQVQYESRYDHQKGLINLEPFKVDQVDLWKATIALMSKGHLELNAMERDVGGDGSLTPANARNISSKFAAGDLSSAIYCYTTTSQDVDIKLQARKLSASQLLEAKVLETRIATVVSHQKSQIHQVELSLKVGNKRYLQLLLPESSKLWSLQVAGKFVVPSLKHVKGQSFIMIPLPHMSGEDAKTQLQFTYVTAAQGKGLPENKIMMTGPKLDLPLHNIEWKVYAPDDMQVSQVEGSLTPVHSLLKALPRHEFDTSIYNRSLLVSKKEALDNAIALQNLGQVFAENGQQLKARQALESSYNYSFSDVEFNNDAKVQLHRLAEQQCIVGLHGTRAQLRARSSDVSSSSGKIMGQDWGDNFTLQDAERLNDNLDKSDSENLELIAKRIVTLQTSTVLAPAQLDVHLPIQGQELKFRRPLLVEPFGEMRLEISLSPLGQGQPQQWLVLLGLGLLFYVSAKKAWPVKME
ncbi:MAG: hypothetical protein HQL32_04475 [Planctomycetes bacterium]|nr:hypothetical protein [Planctomycetota bacterium]